MLEEFILEQLRKVSLEWERLKQALESLSGEEQEAEEKINDLMANEDVGLEIFSPRSGETTVKEMVEELQKRIGEIRYKEAQITVYIENNRKEERKWKKLLSDAKENPDQVPGTMESDDSGKMDESAAKTRQIRVLNDGIDLEAEYQDDEADEKEAILRREELVSMLMRIDKCLELVHSDRNKCKSELKNLRYHMKALISKIK